MFHYYSDFNLNFTNYIINFINLNFISIIVYITNFKNNDHNFITIISIIIKQIDLIINLVNFNSVLIN